MVDKRGRRGGSSYAASAASMSDEDSKSRAFGNRGGMHGTQDDEDDDELSYGKDRASSSGGNKRQRVHFSCTECHRRKQKCNRETPCQHCIARKIPERCKTFQPGEDPNDLGTRVSRLERAVSENFDRLFSMMQHQQQQASGNGQGNSIALGHPPAHPRARGTHVAANIANAIASTSAHPMGAVATSTAGEASEDDDDIVPLVKGGDDGNNDQPISMRVNDLIRDSIENTSQGAPNPNVLAFTYNKTIESAAPLDVVMAEYGAPIGVSQMLISALPHRTHVNELLDHFFEHINWLRLPLSRKRFGTRLEAFYKTGPTLTADLLNVYATLMFVLAIATTTCRADIPQSSDDLRALRLSARRLFFAGRQAMLYSVMLGREDVEQVLAFHTASRYLFLDRRISEAWTCVANAVKAAHSIGLHRDGSHFQLSQPDCEARRRIWSYIYFSDRMLCMNLGRPTAVDDDVVDTHLPSDADETGEFAEYHKPLPGAKIPEGETPRYLSVLRIRHQLAIIMGKVMATYQNLHHHSHYSDVVAIDHELMALQKSLPDHLRSECAPDGTVRHVNSKWDKVYKFVCVHRYLVQGEIFFVRMSLHRPYLLRTSSKASNHKGGNAGRYAYSRRACQEAAHYTLVLRRKLRFETMSKVDVIDDGAPPPMWAFHLGTYNVLHAIVILGIELLQNPHAEFADNRLELLREYYTVWTQRRARSRYLFDETKERDMVILQIFLERIEAARQSKASTISADAPTKTANGRETDSKQITSSATGITNGRLTESPSHATPLSTEEDTAGVLLDLNQGVSRSKRSEPPAGASAEARDAPAKSNEDMPVLWPYLPTRMPHHQAQSGSTSSTKGSLSENVHESSPHTAQPSTGDGSPPSAANGARGSIAQNDDISSANVHQLFDSWFRYNAFDTMEFGGMSAAFGDGDASMTNAASASARGPAHPGGASSLVGGPSSTLNAAATSSAQPWGASLMAGSNNDANRSRPDSQQRQYANAQSGVPTSADWATMPPSGWPMDLGHQSASGGLAQHLASAPTSGLSSGNSASHNPFGYGGPGMHGLSGNSTLVGPPGANGMRGPGPTGADAGSMMDQSHQAVDASYDPMFWQSLIDKISG